MDGRCPVPADEGVQVVKPVEGIRLRALPVDASNLDPSRRDDALLASLWFEHPW